MAQLSAISPMTETQAVNVLLSSIGEAPVSSVDGATQPDVVIALDTLRNAVREVQARRWRFNTEFGYTLTAAGTYTSGGSIYHFFNPPAGILSFTLSRTEENAGRDAIQRPARQEGVTGSVIADRLTGQDGWLSETLRIDPVWSFGFEEMPEAARRYAVVLAARRFQQQIQQVSDDEGLVKFEEKDEQLALEALEQDQRGPLPIIPSGVPTTETDALNIMLATAKQEPVYSILAITTSEAAGALNALRTITRDVLAEGWKFNTEGSYELTPSQTFAWDDVTLNVFTPPAGLLRFVAGQNVVLRAPRRVTGLAQVFYDRDENRDGFEEPTLTLSHAVFSVPFEDLPETARRYITLRAVRAFLGAIPGAGEMAGYAEKDERLARRNLERDQQERRRYNIFNSSETSDFMGGRS